MRTKKLGRISSSFSGHFRNINFPRLTPMVSLVFKKRGLFWRKEFVRACVVFYSTATIRGAKNPPLNATYSCESHTDGCRQPEVYMYRCARHYTSLRGVDYYTRGCVIAVSEAFHKTDVESAYTTKQSTNLSTQNSIICELLQSSYMQWVRVTACRVLHPLH